MIISGTTGNLRARKYGNIRTTHEGTEFASKREAARYMQLKLLERNHEVRNIRLQVPYQIEVLGTKVCRYYADFVYEELRKGIWSEVVEDCKGFRTPTYKLKKKLVKACFGIEIRES